MLNEKYKNFWEKISVESINVYEKETNKKYDFTSLESIIDYINFFGGHVIYTDLFKKCNTDEMLVSQDNNEFLILIDKNYLNTQTKNIDLSIKKIVLRMFSMYIQECIINKEIESNKIIYPKNNYTEKLPIIFITSNIDDSERKDLEKKLVITIDKNNY